MFLEVLGRIRMGYMCGNIKNIWYISDLFLIYLRKIKFVVVEFVFVDVLVLNNF